VTFSGYICENIATSNAVNLMTEFSLLKLNTGERQRVNEGKRKRTKWRVRITKHLE
jgi:hypothetical protein